MTRLRSISGTSARTPPGLRVHDKLWTFASDKGASRTSEISEHSIFLYSLHEEQTTEVRIGRLESPIWPRQTVSKYCRFSHFEHQSCAALHLAKLTASSGSCTSSSSRCLSAMDCILTRLSLAACFSVRACAMASSPCRRRDCTDSRKRVYKLFLSASETKKSAELCSSK